MAANDNRFFDDPEEKPEKPDPSGAEPSTYRDPALYFSDRDARAAAWIEVQQLGARWRETGDLAVKAEAARLLAYLLPSEALVIIKTNKVDAHLPKRRDYAELANAVAASVISYPGKNITAILNQHDPQKASLRTMLSNWLTFKMFDHLRAERVQGQHKNLGGAASADLEDELQSQAARREQGEHLPLDTDPLVTSRDAAFAWTELLHDLKNLLEPEEFDALLVDQAGYTLEEGAKLLGISVSTYRRRLERACDKGAQTFMPEH